jgi:hypothetical protein
MLPGIDEQLGWLDATPFALCSIMLYQYVRRPSVAGYGVFGSMVIIGILAVISVSIGGRMRLMDLAAMLYGYFVGLFILICEVLRRGGAKYLTKRRGSKWVKELDYIYLALGAMGVLGSLSRIEGLTGRFTITDILGPFFLVTALVVRTIKTRAEIKGWNDPARGNI